MLNADKLLVLADAIEVMEHGSYFDQLPGFDMHVWNEDWCDADLPNDCGTASCIGGTAQVLFGLDTATEVYLFLSDTEDDQGVVDEDWTTLHDLFFPHEGHIYWNATPEQAAKVIRHLVATGKVEWSILDEPVVNRDAELDRLADDGGRAGAS